MYKGKKITHDSYPIIGKCINSYRNQFVGVKYIC